MRLDVVRTSPDGLSEQTWQFIVHVDDGIRIRVVLDGYYAGARPTKRHAFKSMASYNRLSPRVSTIKVDNVPLPPDVENQAHATVADRIVVTKSYRAT